MGTQYLKKQVNWTRKMDDDLRQRFNRNETHKNIAVSMGLSQGSVARRLGKLGLTRVYTSNAKAPRL